MPFEVFPGSGWTWTSGPVPATNQYLGWPRSEVEFRAAFGRCFPSDPEPCTRAPLTDDERAANTRAIILAFGIPSTPRTATEPPPTFTPDQIQDVRNEARIAHTLNVPLTDYQREVLEQDAARIIDGVER